MSVYLVRHGENEANKIERMTFMAPGAPLTDLGLRQAHELAEELAGKRIVAVYSSPLLRAQQTARVLGDRFDLPVTILDGLSELRVPELEGAPLRDGLAALAEPWDRWLHRDQLDFRPFTRSETGREVLTRFEESLRRVRTEYPHVLGSPDEHVALVTHGGTLQLCIPVLAGNLENGHGQATPLHNCAVVQVRVDEQWLMSCVSWGELVLEGR